jgi:hypothetical protein
LQDERFQDICDVQLRGQGYVVVQKMPQSIPSVISLFQSLSPHQSFENTVVDVAPRRVDLCEPLETDSVDLLDDIPVSLVQTPRTNALGECGRAAMRFASSTCLELSQDGYRGMVKNSFIQINRHPLTPGLPASQSMPALASAEMSNWSEAQSRSDESTTDRESDRESDSSCADERRPMLPSESLVDLIKEAADSCSPLHGVTSTQYQSILRGPGKTKTAHRVNFNMTIDLHDAESPSDAEPQTPEVLFPDTPFTEGLSSSHDEVDEQATSEDLQRASNLESSLPNLLLSPSCSFAKQGIVSRNTFLHVQKQPPTPHVKKESRRSKSLGA